MPERRNFSIFTGSAANCVCFMIGTDIVLRNHETQNGFVQINDSLIVGDTMGIASVFIVFCCF